MNIKDLDLQFLKSKTILVTGASRGIGKALAEKLLDLGNIVIGTSRNLNSLENLAEKFTRNFYPMELDLESTEAIANLSDELIKKFEKIDVLVCNAGVLGEIKKIEDCNYETWCHTININLNNQFLLVKSLLPSLKKSKKGSIVIISSSVGQNPREKWGAYSISKLGMEGLSKILAQELESDKIIVNTVNPGGTATKMRKQAIPDEDQSKIPQPEDILPIILYLCSNEAHVTSQSFNARDFIGHLKF